jgi:hypothetical protein
MRGMLALELIALLLPLAPATLPAQHADPPIRHSLYVALGGDFVFREVRERSPLALSAGLERGRVGSRWSLRLGADYRRQTTSYSDTRWEDVGVGLTARYGKRSGAVRPYLLGGIGIADLRVRSRWSKYDEINSTFYGPVDSGFTSSSRWNGAITSGLGTELTLARLRVFSEARLNLYPARLSDARRSREMKSTKALFIGVKL